MNEIRLQTQFTFNKNNVSESINNTVSVTVTGNNMIHQTKAAATTDATLPLGAIATLGQCYFKNTDNTNNILIGIDGTTYPIQLSPGEDARCRINGSAIHFKSNAGTPLLEYLLAEA
jgi:hypothetical protein